MVFMDRSNSQARIAAFLSAEALSSIGSWASLVAIWGFAAFEFDAGAGEIAIFGLAFGLPGLFLGPIAGLAVDRFGPKLVLGSAKVLGVVASLMLLGVSSFTSLALISALHGVAATFSFPSLQAMPPRLVDNDRLARMNALVSLTDELAIVLGPVAAAIALATVGFRGAFVFDALTYLLGLVALPLVSLRDVEPRDGESDERWLSRALAGWERVKSVAVLRRTVACTALVHLLYGGALLIEPLYVRDVLGGSEHAFAALQTVFGVTLVAGGIVVARLGERLAGFRTVALAVVGSGIAAAIYLGTASMFIAFVGVVLWGAVTAAMGGPSRTVLQRNSPESEHGRVLAVDLVGGSGAEALGVATLGFLVAAIGLRPSVFLVGSAVALAGLWLVMVDARERPVSGAVEDGLPPEVAELSTPS